MTKTVSEGEVKAIIDAVRRCDQLSSWQALFQDVDAGESLSGTGEEVAYGPITVKAMTVPSANKIVRVDALDDKVSLNPKTLLVKFPQDNIFHEVFDLEEQRIINAHIGRYRASLGTGSVCVHPKVYLAENDIRIDEFLPSRGLSTDDFENKELMTKIAHLICDFHNDTNLARDLVRVRQAHGYSEMTLRERMEGMRRIMKQNFPVKSEAKTIEAGVPEEHRPLARQLCDKMEILLDDDFYNRLMTKIYRDIEEDLDHLHDKQQEHQSKDAWLNRLVASHNDLSHNNTLLVQDETRANNGEPILIDFDGTNLNYRGYDLGYRLAYAMTPTVDESMENKVYQLFLREYIGRYFDTIADVADDTTKDAGDAPSSKQRSQRRRAFIDERYDQLYDQARRGAVQGMCFFMVMLGASTDWVLYDLVGCGFMHLNIAMMDKMVAFGNSE